MCLHIACTTYQHVSCHKRKNTPQSPSRTWPVPHLFVSTVKPSYERNLAPPPEYNHIFLGPETPFFWEVFILKTLSVGRAFQPEKPYTCFSSTLECLGDSTPTRPGLVVLYRFCRAKPRTWKLIAAHNWGGQVPMGGKFSTARGVMSVRVCDSKHIFVLSGCRLSRTRDGQGPGGGPEPAWTQDTRYCSTKNQQNLVVPLPILHWAPRPHT